MKNSWSSAKAHGLPIIAPAFDEERLLGAPSQFAIFHTAALSPPARQKLATLINSADASSLNSKLAPTPDFTGRSLLNVYDHFLELREVDATIQPFYFIVADCVDFEQDGVLGVCLRSSQDEDFDVGVARCGVGMADSWGAQFCNGLADWEEMKEAEADEWVEAEEVDPEQRHADEAAKYGWVAQIYALRDRTVYGWYSLVEKAVPINRMLDPDWLDKNPDQCRFQMLGNYHASSDPWMDIRREHPRQSACRPSVHRTIVLVAEKEDADQEGGIAIVRLESNRAPKVLARVRAGAAVAEADAFSR
ncbi:hypothetical protein OPT61_g4457 [Boeremia exigua]|uniref:Uncharacterized protein n=1 Tax=Boeremia exigua TaxID=749465 RepID=A0ACC2IE35_9PLEO|nr:hypothetical protein OPT61_g4457 [Boeremia exigua]